MSQEQLGTVPPSSAAARLDRTNAMLRLLAEAAGDLLRDPQPAQMIENLFQKISAFLGAELFFNFLLEETRNGPILRLEAAGGLDQRTRSAIESLPLDTTLSGRVAARRQMLHMPDIHLSSDPITANARGLGLRAFAGFPLMVSERLLGTLGFASRNKDRFTDDELEFIGTISHYVALAKERDLGMCAMRASEERFRLAAQAMNGLVYDWDMLRGTVERSQGVFELLGWRPDELTEISDWWYTQMHPEDLPGIIEKFRSAVTRGDTELEYEYRMRHRAGHYVWIWDRCRIAYSETGSAIRTIGCSISVDRRRRAEEELRESEQQIRRIIDNTLAFVGVLAPDGTLIETNTTSLRAANLRREDVLGKKFWDCYWWNFDEESRQRVREAVKESCSGRNVRFDVKIRVAANTYMPIDFMLAPIIDEQGRVTHLIPSAVDITERSHAEEALRDNQALLSRQLAEIEFIYNHAPVGLAVFDTQTRWVRINRQLAEMNGYPPEVHIGKRVRDLLPDLGDQAESLFRRVLNSGESAHNVEVTGETPAHPGVQRTWLEHFHPFRDQHGQIMGIIAVCEETTERTQAEIALRKSEAQLQNIVENLIEGLIISDLHGKLLHWNRAALDIHGFTNLEECRVQLAQFTAIFELVDSDEVPLSLEQWPLSRILRGEVLKNVELRLRKIGTDWHRSISYGGTIIHDQQGEPLLAVITVNDVTERKESEESVRHAKEVAEAANRAKDHFLAVLSHELRTPLTPVLAAAQILAADPNLSESQREVTDLIQRNATLEARLIDDLLDLTRINRGKLEMVREPVDLHQKVGEVAAMMAREIHSKELRFFVELAATEYTIEGDPARTQQIVWNLLNNAIKFTPERGIVRVRTENPGPGAATIDLIVSDDGIGIEPALIPSLFNAFEQGSAEVTRKFGGLGLGLAITKALVDMLGGAIGATSPGRGRGSEFRVTLPVTAARASAGQRPGPRSPIAAGVKGLNILLVEDHSDTRRTMSRLLSVGGAVVTTAGSVSEAKLIIDSQSFDLLLSDIGLPDGSGLDVVIHVKKRRPATKCVAVSGYGMEVDIRRSLEAGFDEHLTKPIDIDRLEDVIARLTGAH